MCMAVNEEATVLDLEEIVDHSMKEVENRRRRHNLVRLDNYLKKLEEIEQDLDTFLLSRPEQHHGQRETSLNS